MPEKQQHGFIFEDKIIKQFNLIKENDYTHQWDAYIGDVPVSIKTSKKKSDINLADLYRNMNIKQDFYLVVGFWENYVTNIAETYILFIPYIEWNKLFDYNIAIECKSLLETITNNKTDDQKWKQSISKLRKKWQISTNNLIRLRFKRDHGKQKRIQCAINYKDFQNYFVSNFGVNII